MSDTLNINIDFTGHSAPQGISILEEGLYQGVIDGFSHYEESNRLYVYINVESPDDDGQMESNRLRESFNLSGKGLDFLLAFLRASGANMAKLKGAANVPFHKLTGKDICFKYVPPTTDMAGEAVQGSYPNFRFYTAKQFKKMQPAAAAPVSDESFAVEEPVADAVEPKTVAPAASGEDEWLTN